MEQNLAEADVPVEDKMDILKNFEKKEIEYRRLQRHKIGVDDFDLLSIIGRGAFGEVSLSHSSLANNLSSLHDLLISHALKLWNFVTALFWGGVSPTGSW